MISFQFTVAFHNPVSIQELKQILEQTYGPGTIEVGQGMLVNGIPNNCLVVSNERQQRLA